MPESQRADLPEDRVDTVPHSRFYPKPASHTGDERSKIAIVPQEGNNRYRHLFRQLHFNAAIYEAVNDGEDFIFLDFNKCGEMTESVKREEVIGRSVKKIFPGVEEFGLFALFQQVWRTGEPQSFPISWYQDERIAGWRDNYVYKLPSGEIVAIYEDATVRKQAEQALALSEEKYRTLVANLQEGIWAVDSDGITTFVNPCMADMLGYSIDEIEGKSILSFLGVNKIPLCKKYLESCQDDGSTEFEMVFQKKDGGLIYTNLSLAPIFNGGGIYAGALAGIMNITHQRIVENALRESEERYRSLFEDTPVAVLEVDISEAKAYFDEFCLDNITDLDSYFEQNSSIGRECLARIKLIDANEIARNLLRFKSRDFSAFEYSRLLSDNSYQSIMRPLVALFRGEAIQDFELELHLSDESSIYVSVRCSIACGYEISLARVLISLSDITKRRQIEEELRQATKMQAIGTLAGGIAHDFNNILYAVLGYAGLAMEEVPRDSSTFSNLQQIQNAGERAADLVKQILTFSKASKFKRRTTHLQPVIKETIQLLRGLLPVTIDIQQKINDQCGPVLIDPMEIQRVLMNLGTNAFSSMREGGGVLKISLDQIEAMPSHTEYPNLKTGRYARIQVEDTGHGMDKATLQRIYDPYFTTRSPGEGTGLGLSTVHGIISRADGEIHVESTPHVGTRFHILLPLALKKEKALGKVAATSKGGVAGGNERILFIDDEGMLAKLGKTQFEKIGYRVTIKTNGKEALNAFRKQPDDYDLIITDQLMPGLTGLELARQVHLIRPEIPIIMISGYADDIDMEQQQATGIKKCLQKPVPFKDLVDSIQVVLKQKMTEG
ncbi:MAG: PAS domain S-box protein [Candidatus Eisenbacteria bacterium]|uniref:histidine kinase n=1 Tax=Eiseniibacteriota bacterium TaxID=2212470 RepID=A0A948WDP4_UNCEI|nr:PAS domain S-box protein [Candidatus Eisenbacteria bacterium]MBU1947708.1 PAS domain S-box protein [Candidatus Eisenbacteria bacterium]MBU2692048.1 PAS domain S-box protein [Candidatus Eisenbacteria bacterium]